MLTCGRWKMMLLRVMMMMMMMMMMMRSMRFLRNLVQGCWALHRYMIITLNPFCRQKGQEGELSWQTLRSIMHMQLYHTQYSCRCLEMRRTSHHDSSSSSSSSSSNSNGSSSSSSSSSSSNNSSITGQRHLLIQSNLGAVGAAHRSYYQRCRQ